MTDMNGAQVVLLVEDNPGDVMVVTEALRTCEVATDVHVAGDGAQALDFLFRRDGHHDAPRPDLVFLDLNLPRVDGHAVLQAVKQDADLRGIPVLVLSSSDAERDVRMAYDRHANAYLTKGFDFAEMQELIRESVRYWLTRVRPAKR